MKHNSSLPGILFSGSHCQGWSGKAALAPCFDLAVPWLSLNTFGGIFLPWKKSETVEEIMSTSPQARLTKYPQVALPFISFSVSASGLAKNTLSPETYNILEKGRTPPPDIIIHPYPPINIVSILTPSPLQKRFQQILDAYKNKFIPNHYRCDTSPDLWYIVKGCCHKLFSGFS